MEERREECGRECGRRLERRLLEEELFVTFFLIVDDMIILYVDCFFNGDLNDVMNG